MFNFLRFLYERPYTSGQVKLALNFLFDSQNMLARENSPDLSEGGFKRHLHNDIENGITNPLVLKYMRKRFNEFDKITSVCDTIVNQIVEYDGARGYWAGTVSVCCTSDYIRRMNRGEVTPPKYLTHFIPLEDIVSGLFYGSCPWSIEPDGSIKLSAIKVATKK